MTKGEIAAVLDRVKTWPEERQADAVAILLRMEEDGEHVELTEEDLRAIDIGIAEAERGEFVSYEEVQALFAKYRS